MITTLLVLMLMTALLVGFTTVVMSDQRYRFIDRDRGQAFYAASAGVEKLTADIGNLFLEFVAPTATQVQNVTTTPPAISGITFTAPQAAVGLPASQLTTYHCNGRDPVTNALLSPATKAPVTVGGNGYTITFCKLISTGNPTVSDDNLVISGTGAYSGMTALQSPYQLDVTAKTAAGGEVHLVRTMQSVAIPVFQFGIFSESDLSFFAEQNFGFGGRIHTNGNLWMGQFSGSTLTTTGKITAVGDVVRQYMSNGASSTTMGLTGTVSLATSLLAPTGNRSMALTEGSVVGLPGSAATTSPVNWQSLSNGTAYYNGFIKTTSTGAKKLSLPLTATGVGGANIDLIRRPCTIGAPLPCTGVADDVNSILYNERLYTKASLRILLSDTAADITNLPGISAGAPVSLETNWNTTPPAGYGAVGAAHPPAALSAGAFSTNITGQSGSAGNYTITVGSTAAFRPPLVMSSLGIQTAITCTSKDATHFLTCSAGVPATVTGLTTFVMGAPGVTTLTTAITALNAASITVASTAAFNPAPFWASVGGVQTLVSCTGYDATHFTGCSSNPSGGNAVSGYMTNAGVSTIGGFIKIDRQNADSTWTDVTMEILNLGIGANNLAGAFCGGAATWDPTPNAIVRLERFRDNGGVCNYQTDTTGAKDPTNWWPNVLFDTRESALRDDPALTTMTLGGVVYYVSLDIANLAKYFQGTTAPFNAPGGSGTKKDNGGFTVYFSDRRNNRNGSDKETGEYGWEDFVNPGVANGVPNGTLQTGEDVNEPPTPHPTYVPVLDTYGGVPNFNGVHSSVSACATCSAVYGGTTAPNGYVLTTLPMASPTTLVLQRTVQMNRPILFRRALKLVRGSAIAPTITGLTVVSENPVYIHGDYNYATPADLTFPTTATHAATAIIADAVTLLSNQWNDNTSFLFPFKIGGTRDRSPNSFYRVAILGGKGINFPYPSDIPAGSVFGTDGGPHNFLRMLEQDGAGVGDVVNYRGSMASLYFNRQGVGTFKCCSGTAQDGIVYSVPVRNFSFDTDFLQPALLPPNTPMFRDLNVIGFSQELRPGK